MKTPARISRAVAAGVALALGLTLSACGGGSSDSAGGGGSDKIHVLVYGDAANKVEKQLVATFNKTSKVKAVLDTIPGADYQQKLQTIISTPQAPDIFFNWGGGSIKPFVDADLLLPLDDFIKEDPALKSSFLPSVFDSASVNGKPYGVPMRGTQPVLLFNNKKVLADAGVTPPKTWDDLLGAVKALKAKGVTPIALGGGDQWPTLMWFEYLYDRVAGPEVFQKALGGDKSAWESAGSKKALGMIRSSSTRAPSAPTTTRSSSPTRVRPRCSPPARPASSSWVRGSTRPSRTPTPRSPRRTSATPRSRRSRAAPATQATSSATPTTSTR